ncbi:MAG: MBOAT family protein, partial [Phycisphaerales bacterium]
MVFSSPEFLFVFLPIFLAMYVLGSNFRNATLLAASIIFYFLGEGYFIGVMAASVLVTYITGRGARSESTLLRKISLTAGIAFNILLLTFYKYVGFISTDILGFDESIWLNTIHLPIGISFFTFQSISYLID